MKILLLTPLFVFCFPAFAVSIMEGQRKGERVTYSKNTHAEIICSDEGCDIVVVLKNKTFKINEDSLGPRIKVIPSQLVLMYEGGDGAFSVGFEVACSEYAERPPSYICLADAHMKDGVLKSVMIFKRTMLDEHVDKTNLPSQE